MASLASTRTLFGFTSPRTLEKIIPEIELLNQYLNGQKWDKSTQAAFFGHLLAADFYEDSRPTQNHDFAGRDRITRAPKSLGFVQLKPFISLTIAGQELVNEPAGRPELFIKQLLKFQLPSPYHTTPRHDPNRFAIRPYLELLRMVWDAGSLSKTEIELFFLPLTNVQNYDKSLEDLLAFRTVRAGMQSGRKAFVQEYADRVTRLSYQEEIAAEKFGTRQGRTETLEEFIAKKQRTSADYADAFFRYLRATQLVTVNSRTFRLVISAQRREEVEYLLANVPRNPVSWKRPVDYEAYLFDPATLVVLSDNPTYLRTRLARLQLTAPAEANLSELKKLVHQSEYKWQIAQIKSTEKGLKHYQQYEDVELLFDKLSGRTKVPDAPLWLEYNVWRALNMMNYARAIQGNFAIDLDGAPLNTAGGNLPDIEVDYGSFRLIVEVTLSSGQRQFDMEGESVARHLGKARLAAPVGVPVYCLFIAPTVSVATHIYFYGINQINIAGHGGKATVVPLSLASFRSLVARGKEAGFDDPTRLQGLFDNILAANRSVNDENEWKFSIDQQVANWLN